MKRMRIAAPIVPRESRRKASVRTETVVRSGSAEIVVIGGRSILGQFPNAPLTLLVSAEADLFPLHRLELADLIDENLGEPMRGRVR